MVEKKRQRWSFQRFDEMQHSSDDTEKWAARKKKPQYIRSNRWGWPEKNDVYNEPSNAIESKYLHIPIECNVLANRDDKEISFFFYLSCLYFWPLFINGMGILMRLLWKMDKMKCCRLRPSPNRTLDGSAFGTLISVHQNGLVQGYTHTHTWTYWNWMKHIDGYFCMVVFCIVCQMLENCRIVCRCCCAVSKSWDTLLAPNHKQHVSETVIVTLNLLTLTENHINQQFDENQTFPSPLMWIVKIFFLSVVRTIYTLLYLYELRISTRFSGSKIKAIFINASRQFSNKLVYGNSIFVVRAQRSMNLIKMSFWIAVANIQIWSKRSTQAHIFSLQVETTQIEKHLTCTMTVKEKPAKRPRTFSHLSDEIARGRMQYYKKNTSKTVKYWLWLHANSIVTTFSLSLSLLLAF